MYLIQVESETFLVEFESQDSSNKHIIGGRILPAYNNSGQLEYVCNCTGAPTLDRQEARVYYRFSYCWRGVWEGRIYFEDDEYWSCELKTMAKVWEKAEQMLKSVIRGLNPELRFEE